MKPMPNIAPAAAPDIAPLPRARIGPTYAASKAALDAPAAPPMTVEPTTSSVFSPPDRVPSVLVSDIEITNPRAAPIPPPTNAAVLTDGGAAPLAGGASSMVDMVEVRLGGSEPTEVRPLTDWRSVC